MEAWRTVLTIVRDKTSTTQHQEMREISLLVFHCQDWEEGTTKYSRYSQSVLKACIGNSEDSQNISIAPQMNMNQAS